MLKKILTIGLRRNKKKCPVFEHTSYARPDRLREERTGLRRIYTPSGRIKRIDLSLVKFVPDARRQINNEKLVDGDIKRY